MKHFARLIIVFVIVSGVSCQYSCAQPLLDRRTLPDPTKKIPLFFCDTTGIRPGPGGNDVIWRFDTLKVRRQLPVDGSIQYIGITEFPPELRDSFPQAQVGIADGPVTSAFMTEGSTFRMLGSTSAQSNLTVSLMDPYDTRPVELVYNEPYYESWRAQIWLKSAGTNPRRTGSDTVIYDGFGLLILPVQTSFTEVARVTRRTITLDTARQGPVVFVTKTQTTTSTWMPYTSNEILLEIVSSTTTTTRNGAPVGQPVLSRSVRARQWDTTGPNSVDVEYQHGSLFPNPVYNNVVYINDLPFEPLSISLLDVSGQRILLPEATPAGSNAWRVAIPEVSSGVYSLIVEGDCTARQCPPTVFLLIIMH